MFPLQIGLKMGENIIEFFLLVRMEGAGSGSVSYRKVDPDQQHNVPHPQDCSVPVLVGRYVPTVPAHKLLKSYDL